MVPQLPTPTVSKHRQRTKKGFVPKIQKFETERSSEPSAPNWVDRFVMGVHASSARLLVRIFDNIHNDEMGRVELQLGAEGVPGPRFKLVSDQGAFRSGVSSQVFDLQPEGDLLRLALNLPGRDAGESGTVELLLAYKELLARDHLLGLRAKLAPGHDLVTSLLQPRHRKVVYRFQATTAAHRQMWIALAKWVSLGCPRAEMPRRITIQVPALTKEEVKRAERDVTLVDLPFVRVTALLSGLYFRQVMGSHKPLRRRVAFHVFQLEMHAWSMEREILNLKKKGRKGRKGDNSGSYLDELRGLNFKKVLERLTMLHYGKRRCLSYSQQVGGWARRLLLAACLLLAAWLLAAYTPILSIFRRLKRNSVCAFTTAERALSKPYLALPYSFHTAY